MKVSQKALAIIELRDRENNSITSSNEYVFLKANKIVNRSSDRQPGFNHLLNFIQ
ncbi:MAG: hypothetical protein F6K22_33955 [Okeania sp. SIO2F4]|uniref:hypothetical protein n=1 Tax=Okeania sp. SIO2F4 TaxID=2607790 RepID=UPI00142B7EBD|nr:hypothetical protein [Okeania sp. SIO2F4]NES07363.1 hypothetical protein [Okeania sp. SIO2F4]